LAPGYLGEEAYDFDGDGTLDLLIADPLERLDSLPASTKVESIDYVVLSGRTGDTVSSVQRLSLGGQSVAAVVPDLSGDKLPDVIVAWSEQARGQQQLWVQAYAGSDGHVVWARQLDSGETPSLRGVELNGDHIGDVIIRTDNRIEALSGEDGSPLWVRECISRAYQIDPSGAPGYAEQDLMLTLQAVAADSARSSSNAPEDSCSPSETIWDEKVALIDGSTGEEVWGRELPGVIDPLPAGDLSNDGVIDILATTWGLNHQTTRTKYTHVRALSGRTGKRLWCRTLPFGYMHPLGADLSGDQIADVLHVSTGGNTGRYSAISGVDGRTIWKARLPGALSNLLPSRAPGAGRSLLETIILPTGQTVVGMRNSRTGESVWQRAPL
jgi:outer membrane protein assembly factor BamB